MWRPTQPVADAAVSDSSWPLNILEIESAYGRLVYLAALRNPDSGAYEHYGVDASARADINVALKRLHESIFREWVSYPLERKKAEIDLYISSLDCIDRPQLIDAWLRLTPYKNLVPAAIRGPDRERHISDFEILLGLLKNVYGVASPDLDA